MYVVAEIKSDRPSTKRIEGAVSSKDGLFTIAYREKGMTKAASEVFEANKVVAALVGEAGYLVVNTTAPIATIVGQLVTGKTGQRAIKTEAGNILLNSDIPGVVVEIKEVDAESREARVAERAAKVSVKVRKPATEAPAEKVARPARRAPAAAAEAPVAARPSRRAAPAAAVAAPAAAKTRRRPT